MPTNLNMEQFQDMVGHLSTPYSLTLTKVDDSSPQQPHNATLHVEVFILNIE